MATAMRGDRVGRYEILTPLSTGGMAELFLGVMEGPGGFEKVVVIKRILPDASRDERFMRMFLDEARITAGFNHPNIAQLFDLGEDDEGLFVVMEFVAGQNLNQVVSTCSKLQHVLPLGFSVAVLNDCALALHYAHTYVKPSGEPVPVVHRDVAQKNVMVTWDGQTKLLDFGIAKAANSLSRTKVGTVKGTAGYMSPEQVRGHQVDGRSDVFSLGVMTWEMVTGRRLFSAETELAEMELILSGRVERPDVVEPVVPAPLADVVMRALAREPADRFPTAKDFSKALMTSCSDLAFDQEQTSAFMRELFSDRIEQTRKLFELSKSKKRDGTVEGEARRLVRSLQESAMSQPVLKPIEGRPRVHAGKRKTRVRQRSAEDEKLLELALKVEQVSQGEALHAPPRRTWGGVVLLAIGVLLAVGVTRRVVLPEKRVSSNGLTLWDGEVDEAAEEQQDRVKPAGPLDTAVIPGIDRPARPPPDEAPGGSEPLTAPSTGDPERAGREAPLAPAPAEPRRAPRVPAAAATGEVTLALLPEGTVFRGSEELARGSLVSFKLPPGTHLLTILGSDGVKRRLSLPVVTGKNPARRFKLDDLPAE